MSPSSVRERTVLPVSTMMRGQYGIEGISLSLPCVVGRDGVLSVIELPLSDEERAGLHASAEILRHSYDSLRSGQGSRETGLKTKHNPLAALREKTKTTHAKPPGR